MNDRLHFFYRWGELDDKSFYFAVREFLDNGVNRFVITDTLLEQMVNDPKRVEFLHQVCDKMQVHFTAVHGLCGKNSDLNVPKMDLRPALIERHKRAIEIAAEFGCKTYVVHVGAAYYCYEKVPLTTLRPLALDMLEKLLPTAEKTGMILAVENSFEMPNSAKEVRGLVDHFQGNPAIGVCYDTGHAHCMEEEPGKDKNKYEPYFPICWWENGVVYENNALDLLKDQVVTCHIHDNNGYGDLHGMPFDGTIDWKPLMQKLFSCPRMVDYQTEVGLDDGENWAGKLLAPAGGYSIRRLVDTFRYLGF